MKKRNLFSIITMLIVILPIRVYAKNIVEIRRGYNSYTIGILYDDGDYFYKDEDYDKIHSFSNVKSLGIGQFADMDFITNDNVLHMKHYDYDNNKYSETTIDNVENFNGSYYLSTDGKFYYYYNNYENPTLLLEDIIEFKETIFNTFMKASNDDLYVLGSNYFGKKYNDGEKFETPYKLVSNVREYTSDYYVSTNNEFYVFYSSLPKAQKVADGVLTVTAYDYMRPTYYGSGYDVYFVKMTNGEKRIYIINCENGRVNTTIVPINIEIREVYVGRDYTEFHVLDTNDNYYIVTYEDIINKNFRVEMSDVKELNSYESHYSLQTSSYYYVLKNNGELYLHVNYDEPRLIDYDYNMVRKVTNKNYINKLLKVMDNVKSIKYIDDWHGAILMNDESIWQFSKEDRPFRLDDLINNGSPITASQIIVTTGDLEAFEVGDEWDMYATVLPYNAISKAYSWSSSNEAVATVDSDGYVTSKTEGFTTICATLNSNENIKGCMEIEVHPKVTAIGFVEGEKITVNARTNVILTSYVMPIHALQKDVTWTVSDEDNSYIMDHIYENGIPQYLPINQRVICFDKTGTYYVTISYENLEATIEVEVVAPIEDLWFDYTYNMFKGKTQTVKAYTQPEDATEKIVSWTSSNTKVATVTNKGVVTAVAPGKATITVKTETGKKESFTINVLETDISKLTITGISDKNCTGKAITQSIKITNGNVTLVKDKDYTITYKNNINPGTASVVIKGIGNYKGTVTKTFKILINSVKTLSVSTRTTSSITLKWSKVSGITGYEIYRKNSSGKYVLIKTITGASTVKYKDSNLIAGKTYYYKVRSYKTVNGAKKYGDYVTLTTAPKLEKATVTLSALGSGKVKVSYKKVTNATKYEISYSNKKVGGYKTITTSKLNYTLTKLTKNKTYYIKVRSYKTVNGVKIYSDYSIAKSIKVK